MSAFSRIKNAYSAARRSFVEDKVEKFIGPLDAGVAARVEKRPPRSWDFAHGENIRIQPRQGITSTFSLLRSVARNCDLVRIAIQMSKDQIRGLDWDIVVEADFDAEALEPRRKRIKEFFRYPDPWNDLTFSRWLSPILEDMLVLDAPALWIQLDRAGRLFGLPQIDGSTIKPIIDQNGFVPRAPLPAYMQVVKGMPFTTFTRDELLYFPYNSMPNSSYGMSPVEMVLTAAHISLKRQLAGLNFYTEGNVPEYLLVSPPDWNFETIIEVQRYLDDYLSGDLAARSKMKLVPSGVQPKEMKPHDFTIAVDEWLARIIAAIFGVSIHGLMRSRSTRVQGTVLESQQTQIGLNPRKKFLAEVFTERIIRKRFGEKGLKFEWLSSKREDEEMNIRRSKAMVPLGATGIDELRKAEGKPPLGVPPYIQLANGILLLTPNVLGAIKDGKVDFINQDGASSILGHEVSPSGIIEASILPTSDETAEEIGLRKKLMYRHEIGQWRLVALTDVRRSVSPRIFKAVYIPDEVQEFIREKLDGARTEEQVKEVFSEAKAITTKDPAFPVRENLKPGRGRRAIREAE